MNRHLKYNVILWILVLLYGCAAQKPAPVDRSYEEKPVETKKEVSKCPDVYTVKEGETIFSISIKCAVDYKTLANANGIKKPYFVKKGDQIRFDIIQTQVDEKVVEGKSDVVEISTYNEDVITEQDASPELILGDPIEVKGPKAFKEVYSKKTLKNTKKAISNQNYKKWGWPTDGQPINAFNPASEKKGVDF
jgi:lipoprotein NlpD